MLREILSNLINMEDIIFVDFRFAYGPDAYLQQIMQIL